MKMEILVAINNPEQVDKNTLTFLKYFFNQK